MAVFSPNILEYYGVQKIIGHVYTVEAEITFMKFSSVRHTINTQLLSSSARSMLCTHGLRQDMTAVFHCNFLAIPHTRAETALNCRN